MNLDLISGSSLAQQPGALTSRFTTMVTLGSGLSVRVERKVVVSANPERDLHGPSVVRAANGDILLVHQE